MGIPLHQLGVMAMLILDYEFLSIKWITRKSQHENLK